MLTKWRYYIFRAKFLKIPQNNNYNAGSKNNNINNKSPNKNRIKQNDNNNNIGNIS